MGFPRKPIGKRNEKNRWRNDLKLSQDDNIFVTAIWNTPKKDGYVLILAS